jgi:hypothetical protein
LTSIIGAGINIAAGAASKIIVKKQTESYLEMVNKEYFAPRRLKVYLMTDEELVNHIGRPKGLPHLA